jgi:hypothetical protein
MGGVHMTALQLRDGGHTSEGISVVLCLPSFLLRSCNRARSFSLSAALTLSSGGGRGM